MPVSVATSRPDSTQVLPRGANLAPTKRFRLKFVCRCGKQVFFRNSQCLACEAPLGYEPELGKVVALEAAEQPDIWRLAGPLRRSRYRRCANLTISACNWLVKAVADGQPERTLCASCRLDRTIPDLSLAANVEKFTRISIAKRRLVALLISLQLPLASRLEEDPERGIACDFLNSPEGGQPVMTGHVNGIITLNVDEADDAVRERVRDQMGEPYRTVLGHLRHETGHYYWDRLISGTAWMGDFQQLFGDPGQDYSAALQAHYQNGPAPDWRERFVSAYASSHPWEDWAESWAHYLHIIDTLQTAIGFGVNPETVTDTEVKPFTADALYKPSDPGAANFLLLINSWIRLTTPLNELSRAMGIADFYPFVISRPVVAKLHFVHAVVTKTVS